MNNVIETYQTTTPPRENHQRCIRELTLALRLKQPGLFSLPQELRDQIWELVLVRGCFFDNTGPYVSIDLFFGKNGYKPPPLLATNWRIRLKAAAIYYRKVQFAFEHNYICVRWLRSVDSLHLKHIKQLAYYSSIWTPPKEDPDYLFEEDSDDLNVETTFDVWKDLWLYFARHRIDVYHALRVCYRADNQGPILVENIQDFPKAWRNETNMLSGFWIVQQRQA